MNECRVSINLRFHAARRILYENVIIPLRSKSIRETKETRKPTHKRQFIQFRIHSYNSNKNDNNEDDEDDNDNDDYYDDGGGGGGGDDNCKAEDDTNT